jgi:REP element-mobilizing transposase RayT
MKYDPAIHHRLSARLRGYDYSRAGMYFVTICAQNRECLFGEIIDGEMWLNDAGKMVQICWNAISDHFPHVELDAFVVMPNHVHGILSIVRAINVGAKNFSPLQRQSSQQPHGTSKTIGSVVRGFKIGVTKWMRQNTPVRNIWQRNYWEHIIRDEPELNRIREYIRNNPAQWESDKLFVGANLVFAPGAIHEPSSEYPTEVWMV